MCAPCTTKSLVNRIIQQWSFIWCFVWYVCIQYLICAHDNNNSGVLHAHFIIWLNPSGISIMVYCLLFSCFSSCFTLYSDIRIVKRSLFQWSMWRWCRHTDTHTHKHISSKNQPVKVHSMKLWQKICAYCIYPKLSHDVCTRYVWCVYNYRLFIYHVTVTYS